MSLGNQTLITRATGNAFPVPMLGAVLIPIIGLVGKSSVVQESGCKRLSPEELSKLGGEDGSAPAGIRRLR